LKRKGDLFESLTSWRNLLQAARRARLRKRYRDDVLRFQYDLEPQLHDIQQQLVSRSYQPGAYRSFEITDPKRRLISAAPYRDRVVHHAICNVIEPILDRQFIFDSYACRKGKGQQLALQRAIQYSRGHKYCLKTDVRKYFPSIDHEILMEELQRRFRDRSLIALIGKIVAQPFPKQAASTFLEGDDLFSVADRRCGLPIGNQTSQLFGNLYLDRLDHWLKESLRVPGYVRYMDDLVLFSDSKEHLWAIFEQMTNFAATRLRLRWHERKTYLTTTQAGFRFLGFHLSSKTGMSPFPENVVRFRKRLKNLQRQYDLQEMDLDSLRQSVYSFWGYFRIAQQINRFRRIIRDFPFFQDLLEAANAECQRNSQ
jgi:retron-type reverse transcriptase